MVNVPPVWFLALLGAPLARGISYWVSNRPEGSLQLEPGETELAFGEREGVTCRLSAEYLCPVLYELSKCWSDARGEL